MEIIKTDVDLLGYPVGEHISQNIPLIKKLAKVFTEIEYFKEKKINLICMGSSGSIMASIFADNIPNHCKIIHIKKEGEGSHSGYICPSYLQSTNIIIDDFISSGETMKKIFESLVKVNNGNFITIECLVLSGDNKFKVSTLPFEPLYLLNSCK